MRNLQSGRSHIILMSAVETADLWLRVFESSVRPEMSSSSLYHRFVCLRVSKSGTTSQPARGGSLCHLRRP
jgi:hypothetical protein